LEIVGRSLNNVHEYSVKQVEDEAKRQESLQQQRERLNQIKRGEWHDGRLDVVAGNGIMSELGIGDEKFGPDDADGNADGTEVLDGVADDHEAKSTGGLDTMGSLPVVVIRGFEDRVGGKSDLLDVVAQWATSLVDNKVSKSHALHSPELVTLPLHLDRTCDRAERQPGKRQTAFERYWNCYSVACVRVAHSGC